MAGGLPGSAELRRAASELWPELRLSGFRIRHEGWSHLVLETDQQLIFRFPRRLDVAQSLTFEVRLLEHLSRRLSTPIPEPLRLGALRCPRGWPFLSYRKLPGVPLSVSRPLDRAERRRLGGFVATLLDELAGLSSRPLRCLGCAPGDPSTWRERYVALLARYDEVGARRLPRELDRRLRVEFDSFFRTLDRSRYVPVLSHLDLGPDHILWDHRVGRPTGVLDWEDARFADPAFDLTGLGFLGPRRLAPLVAARRDLRDEKFLARLAFYRGAVGVHQLLYAVEQGDSALVLRSTRALSRALAPAPAS